MAQPKWKQVLTDLQNGYTLKLKDGRYFLCYPNRDGLSREVSQISVNALEERGLLKPIAWKLNGDTPNTVAEQVAMKGLAIKANHKTRKVAIEEK